MKLNRTDSRWDRNQRIDINDNWDQIESENSRLSGIGKDAENTLKEALRINAEAERVNKENVSTQKQVDELILHAGQSDAEVIQARGGLPLLKDRFDYTESEIDSIEKYDSQFDFVGFTKDNVGDYEKIVFKKVNTAGYFDLVFIKGERHLSYQFRTSADDYIVLGEIFTGVLSEEKVRRDLQNAEDRTGSWNTSNLPSYFTTEVGASFTINIVGEDISFSHYADDRGGLWEFVIDGDTNNPVQISTFSTTSGTKSSTVIEGLEDGEHTIVATFKGGDPNNQPSNGTARGWVYYYPSSSTNATLVGHSTMNTNSKDKVLSNVSNKEFAFDMRPQGSGTYQFVPVHSGTPGVNAITPPKIIVNGTDIDTSSMLNGSEIKGVNDFKLLQRVYARNDVTENNLAEIATTTVIDTRGMVYISGKMTPLENIEISEGYSIMSIADNTFTTRFVSGLLNSYTTTSSDGSRTYLVEENDRVSSGAFLSDAETDFIVAHRFDDMKRTLRQGEEGKYSIDSTHWIHHRANFQKIYNSVFKNATLSTEDIYLWKGAIIVAEIPGVNYLF